MRVLNGQVAAKDRRMLSDISERIAGISRRAWNQSHHSRLYINLEGLPRALQALDWSRNHDQVHSSEGTGIDRDSDAVPPVGRASDLFRTVFHPFGVVLVSE